MNSNHEGFCRHIFPSEGDLRGLGLYPLLSLAFLLVRQAATRAAAFILALGFCGFFIGLVSFITQKLTKFLYQNDPKLLPFTHKDNPQGIEQYLQVERQ
jgi:hypothetical protein